MSSKPWQISGSWVPHRLEMLQSPAWTAAPRALKAWLEVLEIELMRHKGCANGELTKSYSQFIKAGFNRNTVSMMGRMGESLGLVRINRQSGIGNGELRDACVYTLTYLPTGVARNIPPTDDWKRIKTIEQAEKLVEQTRYGRKKDRPTERKVA